MRPIIEENISAILRALQFAAHKHRDQRRKDAQASPYINHPIAVAVTLWETGRVQDISTIVAGLLHDTLEDTDTSPGEIESAFGAGVRSLVEELSDDPRLPKPDRKRLQVEGSSSLSPGARLVRIADKCCNIQDLIEFPPEQWSVERRREYVRWATEVIERLRGTNLLLEARFDQLAAAAREAIEAHERARRTRVADPDVETRE